MNACLWCGEPTGSEDVLCPEDRAVHDHPRFYCKVPGHTVPTLGPSCAECDQIKLNEARRAAINAPLIAELEKVMVVFMRGWHKPWPGADFGKAIVGNAIAGAIEDLGGKVSIPPPGDPRFHGYDPYAEHLRGLAALEARRQGLPDPA